MACNIASDADPAILQMSEVMELREYILANDLDVEIWVKSDGFLLPESDDVRIPDGGFIILHARIPHEIVLKSPPELKLIHKVESHYHGLTYHNSTYLLQKGPKPMVVYDTNVSLHTTELTRNMNALKQFLFGETTLDTSELAPGMHALKQFLFGPKSIVRNDAPSIYETDITLHTSELAPNMNALKQFLYHAM